MSILDLEIGRFGCDYYSHWRTKLAPFSMCDSMHLLAPAVEMGGVWALYHFV